MFSIKDHLCSLVNFSSQPRHVVFVVFLYSFFFLRYTRLAQGPCHVVFPVFYSSFFSVSASTYNAPNRFCPHHMKSVFNTRSRRQYNTKPKGNIWLEKSVLIREDLFKSTFDFQNQSYLHSRSHSSSFCFQNFVFLNKDRGKWLSSGSSQMSNVRLEEVMRRNENAKTWKHKKNTMQICKKVRMLKTQICRNAVVATPNPQSLSHSWIS